MKRPISSMHTPHDDIESMITEAASWVDGVWRNASLRWQERSGQDRNYRSHVIMPAVGDIIRNLFGGGRNLDLLDLGCGDGVVLDDPLTGDFALPPGSYLGIDRVPDLIEHARHRHRAENISFMQGDLTDTGLSESIAGHHRDWDCVLSLFVPQELPDITSFLSVIAEVLDRDSRAVLVTVHPEFAEWLRETGHIRVIDHFSGSPLWDWAGLYPIVDEPNEPFYLPHFQRGIETYVSLCGQAGLKVETIHELPEPDRELPRLVKEGTSPFAPFETNVYWPRIGEAPSAVALVISKETHG